MGAMVKAVLHELEKTAQLILWGTTSDCPQLGQSDPAGSADETPGEWKGLNL